MKTSHLPATHEEIARRAFEIWCEHGRPLAAADENWQAAERDLDRQREHRELTRSQAARDATD